MIDFSLTTKDPVINRDIDNVLQQIDMLFDTRYGEVLGNYPFGSDFDKYIWDLKASNNSIAMYVDNLIDTYVDKLDFDINTKVTILEGTDNDIILIQVSIKRDYEYLEKTYKITE